MLKKEIEIKIIWKRVVSKQVKQVEYKKTVSKNNILLTPNLYLPVSTEAAPEVERNKIK